MKSFVLTVFVACLILVVLGRKARFDNYRVYSAFVENDEQLKVLRDLEINADGILFLAPLTGSGIANLIVPPHKFADISELFDTYEIKSQIKTENVQKLIDAEQSTIVDESFGWKKYYDLDAIHAWLDQLLVKYPTVLTNYNYGKSYEGRTLRAIKVSHKKNQKTANFFTNEINNNILFFPLYRKGNPTIFIESNIHAREWITAATATYLLNELVTSNETDIRYLADNYDFVIVPVMNVDGYVYTHTTNRMWRKTRQPSSTKKRCIGTDGNRNFGYHHAEGGASSDPCSEIFAGPKPFSEPETLALAEFVKTLNLQFYIAFHSYSQQILYPFGYTTRHAPNYDDLKRVGFAGKKAIEKRYGTIYTVELLGETVSRPSGTSIDWVYGTQNVPFSYLLEFRDKGHHGFLLPADQIIPNALEIIDGLVAMVKEANRKVKKN